MRMLHAHIEHAMCMLCVLSNAHSAYDVVFLRAVVYQSSIHILTSIFIVHVRLCFTILMYPMHCGSRELVKG